METSNPRKLTQGQRTLETLKQPQYKTLAVEKQVVILYAVVNGHLVPLNTVLKTGDVVEIIK